MDFSQILSDHGWPALFVAILIYSGVHFVKWAKPLVERFVEGHLSLVNKLESRIDDDGQKIHEIHQVVTDGKLCKVNDSH